MSTTKDQELRAVLTKLTPDEMAVIFVIMKCMTAPETITQAEYKAAFAAMATWPPKARRKALMIMEDERNRHMAAAR